MAPFQAGLAVTLGSISHASPSQIMIASAKLPSSTNKPKISRRLVFSHCMFALLSTWDRCTRSALAPTQRHGQQCDNEEARDEAQDRPVMTRPLDPDALAE